MLGIHSIFILNKLTSRRRALRFCAVVHRSNAHKYADCAFEVNNFVVKRSNACLRESELTLVHKHEQKHDWRENRIAIIMGLVSASLTCKRAFAEASSDTTDLE